MMQSNFFLLPSVFALFAQYFSCFLRKSLGFLQGGTCTGNGLCGSDLVLGVPQGGKVYVGFADYF